jgi:hypothetical protein
MSGMTTTVERGSELTALTWSGERELSAKSECAGRTRALDWWHVAYWLVLFVCRSMVGIVVGGYVGFIQAATPAVDLPGSYARMAAADVGWTAKARQAWLASHPLDSARVGQHMRETRWQRLVESAAAESGAGLSDGAAPRMARVQDKARPAGRVRQ